MPPVADEPSLLGPDVFRFLNLERRCGASEWEPRDAARLWTYNLHYFDDLNARAAESRSVWHVALIERWIAENPPSQGPGWEPYPASLRIVNWVKWAARGGALTRAAQASLAIQARWLAQRLEYHLLGNHLLANAKALIHAGQYFEGREAEHWFACGMKILTRELREQILDDGGHFELTPLYHAIVLEDLLDLVNVLRAYGRVVPAEWLNLIDSMHRWQQVMTHPDGELALFNDAAFGVAPTLAQLQAYTLRLGLAVPADAAGVLTALPTSGYVRALAPGAYLICDCGPIGPDYLPAHAHADTLSFELSLAGRRVLVNSGTSEYGLGPERQRQRGSAAHNTVVIDDRDSSEVWAGFRVARRARAQIDVTQSEPVTIAAHHDGYERLPGRNIHARRWQLEAGVLQIEDRVAGSFRSVEAFFHLHPNIEAQSTHDGKVRLRANDGECAGMHFDGAARVDVRQSTWHPYFGVSVPNVCIVARFAAESLRTRISWTERQ